MLVIFLVIIGSVLLISWFPNTSILIGIIGVVLGINWLIKNDKYVKAVLVGTQITIEMTRQDLNKSYIGHTAGLEFAWQPKN